MSLLHRSVSAVWSSGSWLMRSASRKGLIRPVRLDARVMSVGNLQAGGSGKTPVVAQIAREAAERGLVVCILTRGYRGEWESGGGMIEPGDSKVDPALSGDEAALLHELAPKAWIGVGSDRVQQFERVKQRAQKTDLVLLDDGFQHWKIQKDLEILTATSADPQETFYRDWPAQAEYADLIALTKGDRLPFQTNRPFVKISYKVVNPPPGKADIWLVCGVADPASVRNSLTRAGWLIRREVFLRDHASFQAADVARWMREASSSGSRVAITGKDWVKWQALGIVRSDIVVIEPELVFESGREQWEKVLWG